MQAPKAQFSQRLPLNPKHTARRNQCRACAIVRGIPPESSECDDALVARQRIGARRQADSGSPKARHIRVARKSRGSERQVSLSTWRIPCLSARSFALAKGFAAAL